MMAWRAANLLRVLRQIATMKSERASSCSLCLAYYVYINQSTFRVPTSKRIWRWLRHGVSEQIDNAASTSEYEDCPLLQHLAYHDFTRMRIGSDCALEISRPMSTSTA